jgi:ribosome recycling factor
MDVRGLVASVDAKFDKALEHLDGELSSLRTGRASTSIVDGLNVDVYGQQMNLKTIATITTPDAQTIAISPWDKANLQPIEKMLRENTQLGLNPNNDGHTIRLNIPPLTEERRRDIVKSMGPIVEAAHIAMRSSRHEVLDAIKKLEKDKQATQDDVKWAEDELNKKVTTYKAKVNEVEKTKTTEIMTV